MGFKLLVLVLLIKIAVARIRVNVNIDKNQEVNVSYQGTDSHIITDDEIASFKIGGDHLYTAVEKSMGKRPDNVYLRSPTPWGDLYKSYKWDQVKRVISVKSARVKNIHRNPIVVVTQDSENPSGHTIRVNTGLSRTVENTLTTSWSSEAAITISQDVEYEINVGIGDAKGKTGFSCTTTLGLSEQKTKSETIGATSNVEIELKPGEAVSAVLTAIAGYLEIEVVHEAYLTGYVAVNYDTPYKRHHFHPVSIGEALSDGGINNKITLTETILINFYAEAKLKVYDKKTGLLM